MNSSPSALMPALTVILSILTFAGFTRAADLRITESEDRTVVLKNVRIDYTDYPAAFGFYTPDWESDGIRTLQPGRGRLTILAQVLTQRLDQATPPVPRPKAGGAPTVQPPTPGVVRTKSDRERAGLRGAVRTVRSEMAKLSNVGGKLEEGPRRMVSAVTYDVDGQIVEETLYGDDGSLKERKVRVRDAGNKWTGTTRFGPDGTIIGRDEVTLDPQGNVSRLLQFKADGETLGRTEDTYDANGNRVEATSYNADGSRSYRSVYRRDASGNMVEFIIYSEKDWVIATDRYMRDEQQRLIRSITIYGTTETSAGESYGRLRCMSMSVMTLPGTG